ncbi:phage/plasmid primase, P4 family [Elioraea tepidiphila]|uniref:phage/plasmid primase, P4 family n=1 Tax=Elioraea tepidiphila TaxID=457934 RepID=UPI0003731121|nr:phage/plasmid primase, P4 family [Elioraea tepidiphila]
MERTDSEPIVARPEPPAREGGARPKPNGHTRLSAIDTPTEDAAALAFTAEYRGKLLFDHDAGRWLEWSGSHWQPCRTPRAFHYARELARSLATDPKAKTPGRAAFAAAVERFAQADPAHARHSGDFDRDPWLLATPGGTIDLRTGATRPADPSDMITQCTAVAPAPAADCPCWMRFLHDATQGDAELIGYLQRFAGYCLTGSVAEHILMFIYGTGQNGKTVFYTILQHVLGDHATIAAPETFAASHHDRHPCDLAMLRGARLVVASETDEGRPWAEARVKALTGGDPITARFMRRDFFTFSPTFKLLIVGNHKPVLRNVDEAMRRRIHIVPFLHRPPQPDPYLGDALKAEAPGILRWAIDGCLAWQRVGLAPPAVVRAATDEYLQDQDAFAAWAAERIDFAPSLSERPGALLADFNAWAARSGEPPRSRHALKAWMDRQPGIFRRTLRGADYVCGCALRPREFEP